MKFEEWLSQQNGVIEVDCGCVTTEAFYHWMRVAYEAGNSPVIPEGYAMVPKEPTAQMYDAGDRQMATKQVWDAMLAAAPQEDINALIPVVSRNEQGSDRWIPVSERMPEDRISVILWDAEIGEVTSGHYSHKTQTFYHCGDAIENEITHWMPPPCAPQEVK